MGNQGKKEEKKQREPRDPKWELWEMHLAIEVVITVRNKYAQGIGNVEMLLEFNRVYLGHMEECEKRDHCVDHHGVQDRRVSVQMSKQHHISEVLSNSRSTPISRHFKKILCAILNHLLPLLTKILDKDHIPYVRQIEDVLEEFRVMY